MKKKESKKLKKSKKRSSQEAFAGIIFHIQNIFSNMACINEQQYASSAMKI